MQFHFPGQNYTGPGTRIATNFINNVKPNNKTDAATMMHDVDYMIAKDAKQAFLADVRAIANSDNSLAGLATKAGLVLRSAFLPNSFYGGDAEAGKQIKMMMKNDPNWIETYSNLGMSKQLKNW